VVIPDHAWKHSVVTLTTVVDSSGSEALPRRRYPPCTSTGCRPGPGRDAHPRPRLSLISNTPALGAFGRPDDPHLVLVGQSEVALDVEAEPERVEAAELRFLPLWVLFSAPLIAVAM
jgi:hypothetical protein